VTFGIAKSILEKSIPEEVNSGRSQFRKRGFEKSDAPADEVLPEREMQSSGRIQ
jgi:hypothetical protein